MPPVGMEKETAKLFRIVDMKTNVSDDRFDLISEVANDSLVEVDWLGAGRRFIKLNGPNVEALDTVEGLMQRLAVIAEVDVGDLEDDL